MIYNENGTIVVQEYIFINGEKFNLSVLNESSIDNREYENLINDIKEEIKKCDDEKLNKLNDIEKTKVLKRSTRRLLNGIEKITSIGGTSITIGGAVSVLAFKNNTAMVVYIGALISAISGLIKALLIKSINKQEKIDKDIINIAYECVKKFRDISANDKFSDKIRESANKKANDIEEKIEKLNSLK